MYKYDIIITEEKYLYQVVSYNSNNGQEKINDC